MIDSKIKDPEGLSSIILALKNEKKKIVFTNGCFDMVHAGHVAYLEDARREGDILVVALNSDNSVKRLKGDGRPINKEIDRQRIIAALASVDYVTLFDEDDPKEIVEKLQPDVIVKGSDWKVDEIIGGEFVKSMGGKAVAIPFRNGYSTTDLIKKIKALKI